MRLTDRSTRLSAWISTALLVAGSLLFVAGGRLHPRASTAFGAVGTPEFYRTFANHIQHQANWVPIHALILVGPLLWALGTPVRRQHALSESDAGESPAASALDGLATRALLLGAALWAVVFVLDGFVAPRVASALAAAAPADVAAHLAQFQANQATVISLGLVSWILIGLAMAFHGASMLVTSPTLGGRSLLGASGVLVGVWPVVATISGEFIPGPFTSSLWNVTALASALWFAAFGVSLLAPERVGASATPRNASADLALQG
jgi:hypothetical protein